MALQKVKAVSGASGERGIGKEIGQEKGRQWSAHFLELLLHEFEEEEHSGREKPAHSDKKETKGRCVGGRGGLPHRGKGRAGSARGLGFL